MPCSSQFISKLASNFFKWTVDSESSSSKLQNCRLNFWFVCCVLRCHRLNTWSSFFESAISKIHQIRESENRFNRWHGRIQSMTRRIQKKKKRIEKLRKFCIRKLSKHPIFWVTPSSRGDILFWRQPGIFKENHQIWLISTISSKQCCIGCTTFYHH